MTDEMDAPTVLLQDTNGRSLLCYLEHTLDLKGQEYGLLQPVDAPVVFFTWEDPEDEEPILVEDDAAIEVVFSTAKAVLSEQNLTLLRTAVTLTAEGDLPDIDDLEGEEADIFGSEEEDLEEFQLLATFFHNDQEYAVYTPLEPFLIVARLENGEPKLLSQEEYDAIEPLIEEHLALEDDTEDDDAN
jgi:hypothetical protein